MDTALAGETVERNRLLGGLPPEELASLLPHLEHVPAPLKYTIIEPERPIDHVLFPLSGIISVVSLSDDGVRVEVGTVGREGFVGIPVLLGAGCAPTHAFAQVAGEGLRIEADTFRREVVGRPGELARRLWRYTQAFLTQVSQSAACNRLHTVEERLARWLLMAHDRVDGDQIPLTQEFLAEMLGVRRAGVTVAAGALQHAGIIRYTRGRITVVERARLEQACCGCYDIVKRHMEALLP